MKWSLYLGKVSGVKLFIHWTFLILIAWILISQLLQGVGLEETLWTVFFVLAVFGCVTLHELGHSFAAKNYGIETQNITLLPIGGVASLEKIPERPKEELVVALAGPMVNVVISVGLFMMLLVLRPELNSLELDNLNRENFLPNLMTVNLFLVIFNLLPAFPMDGGRVLRALLSMKLPKVTATRWAVGIGQAFAIGFAFWGLFNNPLLILIGIFIFLGAQAELGSTTTTSLLQGASVKDIVMKDYTPIHPTNSLSQAVEILLNGQESHFVVMEKEEVVGTLSKASMIKGLQMYGQNSPIDQVMNHAIKKVHPSTPVEEALSYLSAEKYDLLLVYEEEVFHGIIDYENISEYMLVKSAISQSSPQKETSFSNPL
ncbi:MAG: site-2 protease family protein [Bacteroidota bacterium]